jgi:hypothetical protein
MTDNLYSDKGISRYLFSFLFFFSHDIFCAKVLFFYSCRFFTAILGQSNHGARPFVSMQQDKQQQSRLPNQGFESVQSPPAMNPMQVGFEAPPDSLDSQFETMESYGQQQQQNGLAQQTMALPPQQPANNSFCFLL